MRRVIVEAETRQTMSRRGRLCVYTRCVFKAYDTEAPDEEKVPVSGKMSSEEEDVFLCYVNKYRKRKRAKRRFWVHPYLKINNDKRLFIAAKQMTESDDKY